MSGLLEALAESEHARWSRWMRYLFSRCRIEPTGARTIPPELVAHWRRQCETPYAKLSEAEKESDRKEARRTIEILERHAAAEARKKSHRDSTIVTPRRHP